MLKVLIVASGNSNQISPFIQDQIDALEQEGGIEISKFLIEGRGIQGYLKNYKLLIKKINSFNPDLIHAHYGLSGLLSGLQRRVPVITTFHGSDINNNLIRPFSRIAYFTSARSIFVSEPLASKANISDPIVIPCGVDLDVFYPIDQIEVRDTLNLDQKKKYILFSSSFEKKEKNYSLAKDAVERSRYKDIKLLELKGYDRNEVCLLMNAVDLVLMTSFTEGSPQFIKEAMACNTPIVSVDVGDVKDVISDLDRCYITSYDPQNIADKINIVINKGKTEGRTKILYLSNKIIAKKILLLYRSVLEK